MGFERGTVRAIARRPLLLVEAIRAWFALRPRHGLGPQAAYLQWRSFTAYGDHSGTASAHDVVRYLEWRREMRTMRKWERVA